MRCLQAKLQSHLQRRSRKAQAQQGALIANTYGTATATAAQQDGSMNSNDGDSDVT
jgi:hypothetical protein